MIYTLSEPTLLDSSRIRPLPKSGHLPTYKNSHTMTVSDPIADYFDKAGKPPPVTPSGRGERLSNGVRQTSNPAFR
jgi:hypothetical protein